MTTANKKLLLTAIGIAISIALIWFLLRNINFQELGVILSQANYWWLIPNALMILVTMYQRAYRWQAMLNPIKKVAFSKLLASTCIGFMANNVLPLRLGEFVRAYSLSYSEKAVSKSASLATIFVERTIFDLVVLLFILGGVLSFSPFRLDEQMLFGVQLTVGVAMIAIIVMIVLALKPDKTGEILSKHIPFIPQRVKDIIRELVVRFSQGLQFLRDGKAVVSVGIQTILIWVLMGYSNYFVFKAFNIDVPIDASFVVLVVVSISILVPSSPGFVGVYHAGAVWALSHYNVPKENAVAFAAVLHATQYIIVTLLGFYFLKKEHLSLKRLGDEAAEEV